MNVGELISKLQAHNPELPVYIRDKGEWLNNVYPEVKLEAHPFIELPECVVLDYGF